MSAVQGVTVCACLCACGVCAVSVVRPAALSVCCVAGFALCGAVGVCRCCAGCAHGECALCCCVCAFINENKGLQCFLNANYGKKLDKNTVCCEKTTG